MRLRAVDPRDREGRSERKGREEDTDPIQALVGILRNVGQGAHLPEAEQPEGQEGKAAGSALIRHDQPSAGRLPAHDPRGQRRRARHLRRRLLPAGKIPPAPTRIRSRAPAIPRRHRLRAGAAGSGKLLAAPQKRHLAAGARRAPSVDAAGGAAEAAAAPPGRGSRRSQRTRRAPGAAPAARRLPALTPRGSGALHPRGRAAGHGKAPGGARQAGDPNVRRRGKRSGS